MAQRAERHNILLDDPDWEEAVSLAKKLDVSVSWLFRKSLKFAMSYQRQFVEFLLAGGPRDPSH